jgi:hypothetical protein
MGLAPPGSSDVFTTHAPSYPDKFAPIFTEIFVNTLEPGFNVPPVYVTVRPSSVRLQFEITLVTSISSCGVEIENHFTAVTSVFVTVKVNCFSASPGLASTGVTEA